jgi:raffinose/stachyose/melibiose transport system substrate-binding protein
MKTMKTSLLPIVALVILSMLLTACGGAANTLTPLAPAATNTTAPVATNTTAPPAATDTTAPVAAATDTTAPAAAATNTTAPAGKSNVTLTYMASQNWIMDAEMTLAKKFETETGIHVDYQIIPSDQYFNVLKTKLNAGEATDIFGGQSGKSDLEVQYDVTNNAVDLSDQEWVKRHDPLALDQVSLNGKVYAAEIWDTVGNNYWVMVYNKAIFQQLGLSVPKTYADFKAACDKIKAAGITPIYEPISDGWHQVLWFPEDGPRYEELNPGLADQLNANKTTFADSKTMLQALQQLQEMYKAGYFGDNTMSDAYADANKALASGKYAMMDDTLSRPASVAKDFPNVKEDTFGFFPIPLLDNQLAPAHPAGPAKFIYAKSPHIAEAKQYLAFLARPDNLQYLLDNTPAFITLDFSGVKPKWTAEQQSFLTNYPAKTIVYQDAVTYVNPQWIDMGKDIVGMFNGTLAPQDMLKNIDQRRTDMAKTAKDPAWPH